MSKAMLSLFLDKRQVAGAIKVGNVLLPGDEALPSFSESACIEHIDIVLENTPVADRTELGQLLTVFYYTPSWVIACICYLMTHHARFPDWIGTPLRLMNIGLKGVLFSLYYSDVTTNNDKASQVLATIGYHVQCHTDAR